MLRSRHTLPIIILAVIIGGITSAVAVFIDWIPQQASAESERVDPLMWFVVWASVAIFTLVAVVLVYSAFRFRAPPGDESDGPPVHGNTTLEIIWTIVPALLLIFMAGWAYLVLSDNEALANDRTVISVTAQQFAWEFTYPGGQVGSGDLRVAKGRQVELKMRSKDVIHDFYVAEFRLKKDIVPGITTDLAFTPNRTGTYQVICAELCGVGHAVMRARVIVMEPAAYDAWLTKANADVKAAAAAPATTAPAGSTATAAPTSTAPTSTAPANTAPAATTAP